MRLKKLLMHSRLFRQLNRMHVSSVSSVSIPFVMHHPLVSDIGSQLNRPPEFFGGHYFRPTSRSTTTTHKKDYLIRFTEMVKCSTFQQSPHFNSSRVTFEALFYKLNLILLDNKSDI